MLEVADIDQHSWSVDPGAKSSRVCGRVFIISTCPTCIEMQLMVETILLDYDGLIVHHDIGLLCKGIGSLCGFALSQGSAPLVSGSSISSNEHAFADHKMHFTDKSAPLISMDYSR